MVQYKQIINNKHKTNYIIKFPHKRNGGVQFQLPTDSAGSYYSLQRKDHFKYLGVLTDDALNWKSQLSLVQSSPRRP